MYTQGWTGWTMTSQDSMVLTVTFCVCQRSERESIHHEPLLLPRRNASGRLNGYRAARRLGASPVRRRPADRNELLECPRHGHARADGATHREVHHVRGLDGRGIPSW